MDRDLVRQRAAFRCEYCLLGEGDSPVAHHLEHIIAKQHGGSGDPENLALACQRCNLFKGPNLTGVDPVTERIVPLFHPRRDRWSDHFTEENGIIDGLTAIGRATAKVMAMNDPRRVELRRQIQAR
jgi:HNH endonuclease